MRREKKVRASLTIEASLSLTLFLFFVILLSVPMEILDTQRKVQTALETAGREIGWQAYITYRLAHGEAGALFSRETAGPNQNDSSYGEAAGGILTGTALAVYLRGKVVKAGGERLEHVSCLGSFVSGDGEEIDLRASYEYRLPFSVFALDGVSLTSRSRRRGWIGEEGGSFETLAESEKEERMVYVGKGGTRYHLDPGCHYISNQISAVAGAQIGEKKNADGRHYRPCAVCGSQAKSGGVVYVLPHGEYYHGRADCSSLAYYVRRVPLSQAEHLGACSYCAGG